MNERETLMREQRHASGDDSEYRPVPVSNVQLSQQNLRQFYAIEEGSSDRDNLPFASVCRASMGSGRFSQHRCSYYLGLLGNLQRSVS